MPETYKDELIATSRQLRGGPPSGFRWASKGVPRKGWELLDVHDAHDDTDAPDGCGMCGNEDVRFYHALWHPETNQRVFVGCICAGHLLRDREAPKKREAEVRAWALRRLKWLTRKWRVSAKGHWFLNVGGNNVGVFPRAEGWKFWGAGVASSGAYPTRDAARLALFDVLYPRGACSAKPKKETA